MLKILVAFSCGFAVACFIGLISCPLNIDGDGILREPFALIPLGSLSTLITLSGGGVLVFKRIRRQTSRQPRAIAAPWLQPYRVSLGITLQRYPGQRQLARSRVVCACT